MRAPEVGAGHTSPPSPSGTLNLSHRCRRRAFAICPVLRRLGPRCAWRRYAGYVDQPAEPLLELHLKIIIDGPGLVLVLSGDSGRRCAAVEVDLHFRRCLKDRRSALRSPEATCCDGSFRVQPGRRYEGDGRGGVQWHSTHWRSGCCSRPSGSGVSPMKPGVGRAGCQRREFERPRADDRGRVAGDRRLPGVGTRSRQSMRWAGGVCGCWTSAASA